MRLIRTEECKNAIKSYFKSLIDKGQNDVDVVSASAELVDIVNNIEMDAVLMPETDEKTEEKVDELQRIYKEKNIPEAQKMIASLCEDDEAFNAVYEASISQANMIISLLEQYMAIGTVEECLAAVEKQVAKKDANDHGKCKNCGTSNNFIINKLGNPNGHPIIHCWNCGQAIGWKVGENNEKIHRNVD